MRTSATTSRLPAAVTNAIGHLAVLCVGALLARQLIVFLTSFAFVYTDEDQALLWTAAQSAARCDWLSFTFPGQTYNTSLESIAAVPLLWLGVPVFRALPIVAALLFAVSIAGFALIALRERRFATAAAILALPMVLDPAGLALSTMPRGFLPGVAACSLGAAISLGPVGLPTPRRLFLGISCMGFGVVAYYTAVFLAVPVGVYLAIELWRQRAWRQARAAAAALCACGLVYAGVQMYFVLEPNAVIHSSPDLTWNVHALLVGLRNMDYFVGFFSPFGLPSLPAFVLLAFSGVLCVIARRWALGAYLVASSALVITALGFEQIHFSYGTADQLFIHPARTFLVLLPNTCVSILLASRGIEARRWLSPLSATIIAVSISCVAAATTWNVNRALPALTRDWTAFHFQPMAPTPVQRVVEDCQLILNRVEEHDIPLMVFFDGRDRAYACEALWPDSVHTLFAPYERRTSRLYEEYDRTRSHILAFSYDGHFCTTVSHASLTCEEYSGLLPLARLTFEPMRIFDWIDRARLERRRFITTESSH